MAKTVGLTFTETIPENLPDNNSEDCGIDLSSMTVAELKAYAADMGIDLNGAAKKDAIISRILEPAEV